MDLQPYVESVQHELTVAASAGGPDAAELAERLTAPLESALRLALLEALSEGAESITRELAPASVEVRLRGRDPEFTVMPAPAVQEEAPLTAPPDLDEDGGTWRVTLRLPENLRTAVDSAARGAGLSVNAWMVRAIASALGTGQARRRNDGPPDKSFSGWVR